MELAQFLHSRGVQLLSTGGNPYVGTTCLNVVLDCRHMQDVKGRWHTGQGYLRAHRFPRNHGWSRKDFTSGRFSDVLFILMAD